MTTFEGIIYAIVHGITQFLPVGVLAHHLILPRLFGLTEPRVALETALALGSFLAVLIYFRHDWASMVSSLLQVILFRKYPMTLDERMPIFILLAFLPIGGAWYYFHDRLFEVTTDPNWIAGGLVGFGALLALADYFGRKSKGMFDWNWLDSLAVGALATLSFVPGCGLTTAALAGSLLRNYRRESAAKFSLFVAAPVLGATAIYDLKQLDFHNPLPTDGITWFTFSLATLLTLLAGLLAIGGLMKQTQRKNFKAYIVYRVLLAVGLVTWFKLKA